MSKDMNARNERQRLREERDEVQRAKKKEEERIRMEENDYYFDADETPYDLDNRSEEEIDINGNGGDDVGRDVGGGGDKYRIKFLDNGRPDFKQIRWLHLVNGAHAYIDRQKKGARISLEKIALEYSELAYQYEVNAYQYLMSGPDGLGSIDQAKEKVREEVKICETAMRNAVEKIKKGHPDISIGKAGTVRYLDKDAIGRLNMLVHVRQEQNNMITLKELRREVLRALQDAAQLRGRNKVSKNTVSSQMEKLDISMITPRMIEAAHLNACTEENFRKHYSELKKAHDMEPMLVVNPQLTINLDELPLITDDKTIA